MSSLVPEWMLKSAGVQLSDLEQHSHLSNHNDTALGVLLGRFDAGAVKVDVFRNYKPRGLQVLAWTPTISEHLFVANQRLSDTLVGNIRDALLGLGTESEGRRVLKSLKPGLTGLVPVTDADYANLRRILFDLTKEE
jgi:phosphonate transport system substrate-binding protein